MANHASFRHWSLKTQSAGSHPAVEKRLAIKEYWVKARSQRWMTEEEAKAHGRHNLLEDNPTSG